MVSMIRAAMSSSSSTCVAGRTRGTPRRPSDDHVGFAQRFPQVVRDGDQHRVPRRVPVPVVDILEVIDVDQQQRLDRGAAGDAAAALRGEPWSPMKSWK